MWKQCCHLRPALEVELSGVHFETILVLNRFARTDTYKNILYLSIAFTEIMDIIRGNKTDPCLLCKLKQLNIHFFLLCHTMILQLQIKILTKDSFVSQSCLFRFFITAMKYMLRHFPSKTSAKTYETFTMLF
ncbi:hypothetical protein D3C76_1391310 [compost metagenome]